MYRTAPPPTREWHVAPHGDDAGPGTAERPLRRIASAAGRALPGDAVVLHAGVYREWVDPPRGGTGPEARITYRAAIPGTAVITGAEEWDAWTPGAHGCHSARIPATFFAVRADGDNPFARRIDGDWFIDNGRPHHAGAVYLDGEPLAEVEAPELVAACPGSWHAHVDAEGTTHLMVHFGADPDDHLVEVNARRTCFYPSSPGCDYLAICGIELRQAATPWAPPTDEQVGCLGAHWCRGWLIEDNVIRHSTCAGITLGKGRAGGAGGAESADGFNAVVTAAIAEGWRRNRVGGHVVRRNRIESCGAAGICGSLGGAWSTISDNLIRWVDCARPWTGEEQAGIKLHGALDARIERNVVIACSRGIWLDWMAQGARVHGNVCAMNHEDDLFLEVNHGPCLVDHNYLLSAVAVRNQSEGTASFHNLIGGRIEQRADDRVTPWFRAHGTEPAGAGRIRGGDDRWYNNLVIAGAQAEAVPMRHPGPEALPSEVAGDCRRRGCVLVRCEGDRLQLDLPPPPTGIDTVPCRDTGDWAPVRVCGQSWRTDDGAPIAFAADVDGRARGPRCLPGPSARPELRRVWHLIAGRPADLRAAG